MKLKLYTETEVEGRRFGLIHGPFVTAFMACELLEASAGKLGLGLVQDFAHGLSQKILEIEESFL